MNVLFLSKIDSIILCAAKRKFPNFLPFHATVVAAFVIVEDDPSTPWFTQQLLVLRGQVVFADDKGGAQGGEYHTIQKPVPLPFKKW